MHTGDAGEPTPSAGRVESRRPLGNVALLVLATLVCLLVAEFTVRALGLAPEIFRIQKGRFRISENPLIGYELVPHFESRRPGPMLDFAGRANSLGFRDREHAIRKPEGTHRSIVLGDSVTQGLGILEDDAVFTAVLERRLDAAHPDLVEVMNFGVSGYNTQQEVETLREKGLVFAPDLVILAYCVNDTWLDSGGILHRFERELERRSIYRTPDWLSRTALFRLTHNLVASWSQDEPEHFDDIRRETALQYVETLAQLSREHGFDVLVVAFPWLDDRDDPKADAEFESLAMIAANEGLHFLDLSDAFARCAKRDTISRDPIHPNEAGHRCAGEEIARVIDERRIVGR